MKLENILFITGALLMTFSATVLIINSYPDKTKPPYDKIITACVDGMMKKAGNMTGFTLTPNDPYVVDTNRPDTWIAYVPFTIAKETVSVSGLSHCRVSQITDGYSVAVYER